MGLKKYAERKLGADCEAQGFARSGLHTISGSLGDSGGCSCRLFLRACLTVDSEESEAIPNDQYVTKKNRKGRIRDGKEWERM